MIAWILVMKGGISRNLNLFYKGHIYNFIKKKKNNFFEVRASCEEAGLLLMKRTVICAFGVN